MTRNVQTPSGTAPEQGPTEQCADLDAHARAALDRLTRWAAKALRAPVALISLVHGDRHLVVSRSAPGDLWAGPDGSVDADSPCARVVRSGERVVVERARPRAGRATSGDRGRTASGAHLAVPLVGREGDVRGSFCVVAAHARRWSEQQIELVGELATSAVTEIELLAARADADRAKRWTDGQQAVLELIAAHAPLAESLTELLRATESHAPGIMTSIQLVERGPGGDTRLRHAASPSLPQRFTRAIDGLPVGDGQGIDGTAAQRGHEVVVHDFAGDAVTAQVAQLAAEHGLHAGWSTPISSSSGALLGTFTMYYPHARTPQVDDRFIIDRSIHLARLAIEQQQSGRQLLEQAKRARMLAREQTALQRVATSVAGDPEPKAFFALVAEQAGRLLRGDAGYVLRFEPDQRLRVAGSWARDDERALLAGAAVDPPDGLCSQLRRSGSAPRRCSVEAGSDALGLPHRVSAPIVVDGECWGAVIVARGGARGFPREDEKRIARFAQLASIAVVNADTRERLARQAGTDPLTELANRRTFDERLVTETDRAHRHTRALSVMIVDVDHFKTINDRFGHAAGDKVLVNVADSLRTVMRTGDLLARIGGDEMAIILPDCRAEKAALVAKRMLAAADGTALARRYGLTLSAGVAGLTVGQSAEDLLRCADQALYRAKAEGRNRVVNYESDMPDRAALRLSA